MNYLGLIAYSYQLLGNAKKFEEAMSRFKAALDFQRQNGANNHHFTFAEAVHSEKYRGEGRCVSLYTQILTSRSDTFSLLRVAIHANIDIAKRYLFPFACRHTRELFIAQRFHRSYKSINPGPDTRFTLRL